MNRRDFLKSTAALAMAAAAGKASIEPVKAPALFDHDPKISNGTFNEATWRLAKPGNCFDREEFERAVQKENERLMKSPYFSPPYVTRIEPIPDSDFVQWPPWRDK